MSVLVLTAGLAAASAHASNRLTTGATGVSLKVLADSNTAVVVYQARGRTWIVSASGAINARAPSPSLPQFEFKLSYNASNKPGFCGKYDGPKLSYVVAACKAPDGSYWVAQNWQRSLPNQGRTPTPAQAESELRLSHWKGPLEVFTVKQDWAYAGRFDHLYGSLTYLGKPMYGFKTGAFGVPLDKYGALIYIDTFNSAFGKGWRRDNSFVTHKPKGIFCTPMVPRGGRPAGIGQAYRATVVGPGVLPDLVWQATRRAYTKAADKAANDEQRLSYSDGICHPN
jgi:hypothetical protein